MSEEKRVTATKEKYFQGKLAVITGGSSGIGKATSESLTNYGAKTVVIDTKADAPVDVSKEEELEKVAESLGNIDLLIISAGVTSETNSPTFEEKDLMDKVNIVGVENTLKIIGPLLSSTATLVFVGTDNPPKDYYAKTKREGARFVKQFSKDHPTLKVLSLLAGPVQTPLFEKGKSPQVIEDISKMVPIYEPWEFSEELINTLINLQNDSGYSEKRMYKEK